MKNRDLPEITKIDEKRLEKKLGESAGKKVASWFSKNTWLVFLGGFLLIPPFVRVVFEGLIKAAVYNYWQLGNLGQASKDFADSSRLFAEYYARMSFNILFLVFLGILLVALIIADKSKVERWGLHWNKILPAILYFGAFWLITYFFFVPVGSILSGGESYYIGLPPPTGFLITKEWYGSAPFGSILQNMFFPRSYVAFAIPGTQTVVPGTFTMGFLDFLRVWVLNGPVIIFAVFGYWMNKLLNWFNTPGWTKGAVRGEDEILHPNFKYVVAFMLSAVLIPLMNTIYRKVDMIRSTVPVVTDGIEVQETMYATSTSSVIWIIIFWVVMGILFNLAYKWAVTDRRKTPLSDWGVSLSKWLPAFLVIAVGLFISFATGWHLAPVDPETNLVISSMFGPFVVSDLMTVVFLTIGVYIYFRTRNLIIPALVYSSLPWLLNFIQVTPKVVPTFMGSFIAGILTIIVLVAFTETYRFWAPWVTFNVVYEDVPALDEKTPSEDVEE
ncbi:MAG TPA: hypothetical protein PKV16_06005 [Caldisericia bacterium]|nr:hypothetical protein [Caldisericia bacterium]HPF49258.1 hypothetical protein [Caldisericia bacterium]HPI84062.1 hypothetical protein [Caldisericia bacterium]HPQ93320.1 hypothetical protein [Caldisericia bacterium]HRV75298.1 hypothetical protein [Caldisericia bacterium]